MIKSDPNYMGEIEPHLGRGRVGPFLHTPKRLHSDSRTLQLSGYGHHRNQTPLVMEPCGHLKSSF